MGRLQTAVKVKGGGGPGGRGGGLGEGRLGGAKRRGGGRRGEGAKAAEPYLGSAETVVGLVVAPAVSTPVTSCRVPDLGRDSGGPWVVTVLTHCVAQTPSTGVSILPPATVMVDYATGLVIGMQQGHCAGT